MIDCSCSPTQNMQAYLNVQSVACVNELFTVAYLRVPTTLLVGCWIFASLGCWKIDKYIYVIPKKLLAAIQTAGFVFNSKYLAKNSKFLMDHRYRHLAICPCLLANNITFLSTHREWILEGVLKLFPLQRQGITPFSLNVYQNISFIHSAVICRYFSWLMINYLHVRLLWSWE